MRKNLDVAVWGITISVIFVSGLITLIFDVQFTDGAKRAEAITALATTVTAIATVALAGGIIAAWKTLRVQEEQKSAEALFHMHQILMTPDFVNARRHIRSNRDRLKTSNIDEWRRLDLKCADLVCASYDQAGILIEAKLLSEKSQDEFFLSSWGDSIVDQYRTLSAYLEQGAEAGTSNRAFFRHFGKLNDRAAGYRTNNPSAGFEGASI